MSKTVAVADLVANFDEVLAELKTTKEEVLVTQGDETVAKLIPAISLEELRRPALERLRGSVKILGDIVEPLEDEWDVMK